MKQIPGFPDYGATEDGKIWRITQPKKGPTKDRSLPYEIRSHANGRYRALKILDPNGVVRTFSVHSLILRTFQPDSGVGYQVAHYDGDGCNNALSNLRWATPKENVADKLRHGTQPCGEQINLAVLSRGDIEWIRAYPKRRGMFTEMSKRLQMHIAAIRRAYYGQTWGHM